MTHTSTTRAGNGEAQPLRSAPEPSERSRALSALLAEDDRNPFPVIGAALEAWARIVDSGRSADLHDDWAAVGRACVLFENTPVPPDKHGQMHHPTTQLFTDFMSTDAEAARVAFAARFAPPPDTDRAALVATGEHLLWLGQFDRNTLLPAILSLRPVLPSAEWWRILGVMWVRFEIDATREEPMRRMLLRAKPRDRACMMTPLERLRLAQMPEEFTVYRGCYDCERGGLSWSLSPAIAAKFPFMDIYKRPGDTPLLLTARVRREDCVLLLARGELEVIAPRPYKVTADDLTGYTPEPWPWVHVDDPDAGRLG